MQFTLIPKAIAMLQNAKILNKIALIVLVMTIVAAAISGISVYGLNTYKAETKAIEEASARAVLGERVNGLVLAVVMDSRGIYMSDNFADIEKYGKPILNNLKKFQDYLAEWETLLPEGQKEEFAKMKTAADGFYKARSELVKIARAEGNPNARIFGDNEQNRNNRKALNDLVVKFADLNNQDIAARAEALSKLYVEMITLTAIVALSGIIAGIFISVVIAKRGIAAPISRTSTTLQNLRDKNFAVMVEGTDRGDEIGDMARSLNELKVTLEAAERANLEQEQERLAKAKRAAEIERLSREFDSNVENILATVARSVESLDLSATEMANHSQTTSARAENVAQASEESSSSIQLIVAATEELGSSVLEISRQMSEATTVVGAATEESRKTTAQVNELAEAAEKIGAVVNMINEIANQTNLLALNATIEAARAGEAGKGFAVVANEVKNLATQTGLATKDITDQINSVRNATSEAVTSITSISRTIEKIDAISTTIASAVEEQGSATQEISRNVSHTSDGTAQVSQNIAEVSAAAQGTMQASGMVVSSIEDLKAQNTALQKLVREFLSGLRAV